MGFFRQVSEQLIIRNTRIEDADAIKMTIQLAFNVPADEDCDDCMERDDVQSQLERFAEGQFVAVYNDGDGEKVVGTAHTMRVSKAPYPGTWLGTIGSRGITNHNSDGEWLYGVDMAVRPSHRRKGIGSALYQARFDMIKGLNLRGWYAGGMLMGYNKLRDTMSIEEYGQKVLTGEIIDPTVTMQKNRGFELRQVIHDYMDEEQAGDSAVLIVWENPDYQAG